VVGKGPVPEPGIAQLVTMTASCPAPGNLFPAGTIPVVHAGIDNRSEHTLSGEVAAKLPGQAPFAAEKVSVAPKSKAGVRFVVPVKQPDVYAVTLAFTVDEEQVATADLSIGYQVDRIKPALSVPKGFSEFWDDVVREARSIPLDVEFTPDDERSDSWILVSKIKYRGVEGEYVSGWYCTPAEKGHYRAMLQLPGYGARRIPVPSALARQGWTVLALDLTGRDPESTEQPPPYLTDGILSPATYSLRRIAAHCIQAVEVLRSQPRVDPDRIAVSGPGLGAALAVTVAALDHRVGAVAADVPLFCDIGEALKTATWPYSEIRDYLRRSPAHEGAVMRTLSFFDALNFAPMVTCPVLIGLGLRDTASPAREVFALYNYLPQGKQVEVYPQAGHEAGGSAHWKAKLDWLDKVLPPQP
jgi:cephalosporin-C deacetylase